MIVSRRRVLIIVGIVVLALSGPPAGSAAPPTWLTSISVACTGVTAGYHANVAGNLKNFQGNKNNVLELNGIDGFVFWGVPCGSTTTFSTRKEPDNAVVSFQTVQDGTGAVECDTTVAVPTIPVELIHPFSGGPGCTNSSYTSITLTIGAPIPQ